MIKIKCIHMTNDDNRMTLNNSKIIELPIDSVGVAVNILRQTYEVDAADGYAFRSRGYSHLIYDHNEYVYRVIMLSYEQFRTMYTRYDFNPNLPIYMNDCPCSDLFNNCLAAEFADGQVLTRLPETRQIERPPAARTTESPTGISFTYRSEGAGGDMSIQDFFDTWRQLSREERLYSLDNTVPSHRD